MLTIYICPLCLEELFCNSKHCDREPIELSLFLADPAGWLAQREHESKRAKRGVLLGVFFVFLLFPSISDARCLLVSKKDATTAMEAATAIAPYIRGTGEVYTCRRYDFHYATVGVRYSVWGCESEPGECRAEYGTIGGSSGPENENAYESWPSGRRYRCDRQFGCRPSRGGN